MFLKTLLVRYSQLALFLVLGCTTPKLIATPDEHPLMADYLKLFAKYPVKDAGPSIKAPLNLKSEKSAHEYRTRLKLSYAKAKDPNFAGHYLLVDDIGCGTSCRVPFLIDFRNGNVTMLPFDPASLKYRTDSRLLILNIPDGDVPTVENCGKRAIGAPEIWEFTGQDFQKITDHLCPHTKN